MTAIDFEYARNVGTRCYLTGQRLDNLWSNPDEKPELEKKISELRQYYAALKTVGLNPIFDPRSSAQLDKWEAKYFGQKITAGSYPRRVNAHKWAIKGVR